MIHLRGPYKGIFLITLLWSFSTHTKFEGAPKPFRFNIYQLDRKVILEVALKSLTLSVSLEWKDFVLKEKTKSLICVIKNWSEKVFGKLEFRFKLLR